MRREALALVRERPDPTLVAFLEDLGYSARSGTDHAALAAHRALEVIGPELRQRGVDGTDQRNTWCLIYDLLGGQKSVVYEQKS